MNELKFNSQVCTTKEQSERLLALGLKPETADMEIEIFKGDNYISGYVTKGYWETEISEELVELIPAWSLHRLFEMICNYTYNKHYTFDFSMDYDSMQDVYDSIIEVIERHIKNGCFNKEYLKQ